MTLPNEPFGKCPRLRTRVVSEELDDPRNIPVQGGAAGLPLYDRVLIHFELVCYIDLSEAEIEPPFLQVLPDSAGSCRFEACFVRFQKDSPEWQQGNAGMKLYRREELHSRVIWANQKS